VPSDETVSAPVGAPAPTPVPATPPTADPTTKPDTHDASADSDARQAKVVRAAFKRLGLGTIAAPAAATGGTPVAATSAQACTPIGTIAATVTPQVGTTLVTRPVTRTHRVDDDPPLVRGPPAPLQSPSSPIATAAAGGAATGGVSGERDAAVLADQLVFTLADGGFAVASDCCDHVAAASANAAARAPPVV